MLPIAIQASHSQSVLETGLTIAAIPSGMLLGIFLLGILTKKPRERAAIAGAAAGLCAILFVVIETPIAFTWYVPIGTVVTFSVALFASYFERPLPPEEEALVRAAVASRHPGRVTAKWKKRRQRN
jgi:Na+/proline symporter